jgi:TPR repeat protein
MYEREDPDVAASYYISASDAGSSEGMLVLARMYWGGLLGMVRDFTQAERYYLLAIGAVERDKTRNELTVAYRNSLPQLATLARNELGALRAGRGFASVVKGASTVVGIVTALFAVGKWMSRGDQDKGT